MSHTGVVEQRVRWTRCAEELPDSDTTVMIANPRWSDPVWMGYLDGDVWRSVDGHLLSEDEGCESEDLLPPTHWMHLPVGPEVEPQPRDASAGPTTGWWNPTPFSSRQRVVFHYVPPGGKTLCGRWQYIGRGEVEEGQDDHPDNCSLCRKRKLAQNARAKA